MKKLTAFMLLLSCFLALVGCSPSQPQKNTSVSGTTAPTPTTQALPIATTTPPTTAGKSADIIEVWAGNGGGENTQNYYGNTQPGTIIIEERLSAAIQNYPGENYVFAVFVINKSLNAVGYAKEFLAPFVTDEAHRELFEVRQIVFMSAEQIAALECPSNYWMVLGLAVKSSYDNPLITKENIDDLGNEAQDVSVLFKTDSDDREDIRRAAEEVIANYGITEDMIIHKTTLRPYFIAKLDTEMIARMLEDPMIVSIRNRKVMFPICVLVERASGNEIYIYN